jgi:uncharacterized membrane protein
MMKKSVKYLSSIALIALSLASVVCAAILIGTSVGTVKVNITKEPITCSPTSWTKTIDNGTSQTQDITITNSYGSAITVNVSVAVTGGTGVTASVSPATLTIAGHSSDVVTVTVTAAPDAAPDTYTVTVTLTR